MKTQWIVIVDSDSTLTRHTPAKLATLHIENSYTFQVVANGAYANLCDIARELNEK